MREWRHRADVVRDGLCVVMCSHSDGTSRVAMCFLFAVADPDSVDGPEPDLHSLAIVRCYGAALITGGITAQSLDFASGAALVSPLSAARPYALCRR
jgi:hypothetical protein